MLSVPLSFDIEHETSGGRVDHVAGETLRSELAVLAHEGPEPLHFSSTEGGGFLFGSAVLHPHELVLGNYSVHTSAEALEQGEARIREIGRGLKQR